MRHTRLELEKYIEAAHECKHDGGENTMISISEESRRMAVELRKECAELPRYAMMLFEAFVKSRIRTLQVMIQNKFYHSIYICWTSWPYKNELFKSHKRQIFFVILQFCVLCGGVRVWYHMRKINPPRIERKERMLVQLRGTCEKNKFKWVMMHRIMFLMILPTVSMRSMRGGFIFLSRGPLQKVCLGRNKCNSANINPWITTYFLRLHAWAYVLQTPKITQHQYHHHSMHQHDE